MAKIDHAAIRTASYENAQKFFEDVLQVNENINVSFVNDYLGSLNENIEYYLKEDNEQRKYNYQREVKRCLKNIAMITVRNVIDLKRNIDNTYKNEPSYQIKLSKLRNLDEKRKNIAMLINRSEDVIENQQPVFFRVAMDTQMRMVVNDVKYQLNDSYHNLIEIEKQIIHYLNLIAYQNRIFVYLVTLVTAPLLLLGVLSSVVYYRQTVTRSDALLASARENVIGLT